MCLWASHNKANAALSGNPFPLPLTLYLSLSLCSARSSPLAPFKLIYALLAFCLLALNSIWRVFFYFCFVFCSAHHAMLAIATHRKPLTWVTLRYVALKCKAARPFTSTALHLAPLPFPSFLTCPLFVNSCRRVWLIVVFVCPFWLLFNCAEAVSEGGGESVDEDEELSPIATPPHPSLHALRALRTRSCWLKGRFTPRSDYLQCALPTVQPMWSVHSDRAVVSLSS